MNKIKIVSIIAIVLLAINIFWIWFFIAHKPPHGKSGNPKSIIIEKLHFDEQQIKDYENLIDGHRKSIEKSEQQIRLVKNQLYRTLKENKKQISEDSLIAEIGKVQVEIEYTNYKHFQDIKKLCKPEQQNAFGEFCNEITKLFAPPFPPKNEKH